MPELPDVEAFKRYADSTSLHQKIGSVTVNNSKVLKSISGNNLEEALVGKSFVSTRRHGKNLFMKLSGGDWLLMHFGMTGYLKYFKDPDEKPRHDRVLVHFENDYQLAFVSQRMLGKLGLTSDPDEYIKSKNLGPDALEVDRNIFIQKLKEKSGKLKSALMDQELVSGIGNVYSDEILYQMKINPKTAADDLDDSRFDELYNKTHDVLATAVEFQTDGQDIPGYFLLSRRKKGETCPSGKGKIETMKVSGRTSYYCPACQK